MKKPNTPPIHYPCREGARISQVFGVNREDYAKFDLLGHDGIDLALPVGEELYSITDGVVSELQIKTTGYGRLTIIQHRGFRSYYGHNSEFKVQLGEVVLPGQVIGLSGGDTTDRYSGNSTGPHLHFEIRPDGISPSNGYGGAVDPFKYLLDRYYMPSKAVGTVNAWIGLNLRDKPTVFGSKILQRLRKGTSLEIQEVVNGWAKVHSLRNEHVSAAFLNLTDIEFQERKEPEEVQFDCSEDGRIEAISEMMVFLKNL